MIVPHKHKWIGGISGYTLFTYQIYTYLTSGSKFWCKLKKHLRRKTFQSEEDERFYFGRLYKELWLSVLLRIALNMQFKIKSL